MTPSFVPLGYAPAFRSPLACGRRCSGTSDNRDWWEPLKRADQEISTSSA